MAQAEYDRLAHTSTPDYEAYLLQLGAYQACLRNVTLVDTLIAKADEHHERKRIDTERADDRSIFVSHPYA